MDLLKGEIMKILHCADLHLDSKMETNLTAEQAKRRRYEILETFETMVDYAVDHDITLILIAGDMFDTAQTKQKTIKSRVLDKIRNTKELDFLYLQGNHDKDDFFKSLEDKPQNLKMFQKEWSHYSYGNIVISGIEFGNKMNGDIYSELLLNEMNYNIVALHGQIAKYGNDTNAEIIPLDALQNKYIDYLALGHIHEYRYEKLDYRGNYCYPGCLEGRGFDECGVKGFVVLDTENAKEPLTFISLAKRTFHEVKIDVSKASTTDEIVRSVEYEIQGIPEKDIVKIVLCGVCKENAEIDKTYIEHKFQNRFFFVKLKDQTTMFIDYAKYEKDISLKGEFVRKVKKLDLSETEKSKIIKMGINAILGKGMIE